MDIEILRSRINDVINDWFRQQSLAVVSTEAGTEVIPESKSERIDGKRAIRTKSTGDRVYVVDDNAKTKSWVTSPEILSKLGFEMADVQDVEDSSLLGYQMMPSIYKVDD